MALKDNILTTRQIERHFFFKALANTFF